jgi:Protein of unknown function (DUF3047)
MLNAFVLRPIMGLVCLLCPLAASAQRGDVDMLNLSATTVGTNVPPGWAMRAVRGQQAPRATIIDSAGDKFFRLEGQARAAWFVHELPTPIMPGLGHFTWSWRTPTLTQGVDLRSAKSDDAAARVFIIFKRTGLMDRTPRTLFYSIGSVEPAGYSRASFQSPNFHVVRVGAMSDARQWTDVMVNPFADYRRIWGSAPPDIVAVGVMQDTDQTRSAALADMRHFTWRQSNASNP